MGEGQFPCTPSEYAPKDQNSLCCDVHLPGVRIYAFKLLGTHGHMNCQAKCCGVTTLCCAAGPKVNFVGDRLGRHGGASVVTTNGHGD